MHAISQGDQAAFEHLLERHVDPLFRYALRLCGSQQTAEDLVQETWLTVWAKARQFKPRKARVTTWMHRILYNKFIDHCRKADRAGAIEPIPAPSLTSPEIPPDARWLHHQLMALPEPQRAAIVLAHAQGFNNKDIAHILGSTVRAVESLLARARRTLRQEYNHWKNGS